MKRIMSYILSLAILCTLLSACGETAANASLSNEEYDELADNLLDDWYRYLVRFEDLYGGMRWALSYADPFFEDHSWDNLQIARAALSSAKDVAEGLAELPREDKMTVEDYDKLVQAGADVDTFISMSNQLLTLSNSVLLVYQDYQNQLNSTSDAIFLTYTLETFEKWVHFYQRFYDILLHITAVETDYLLSCLDSELGEAVFLKCIAESCPQINALRKDNPQDPDALSELLAELTNELAELDFISIVGQFKANYDLEVNMPQPDVDGGLESLRVHAEAMASDMVDDLTGFPTILPYPYWYYRSTPDSVRYGYTKPDGEVDFVWPNDAIISPPDYFLITWTGVSLEDYLSYVRDLKNMYHISAQTLSKKDGVYLAIYELQPDNFAIIWEEEEVFIQTEEGSVCFAPIWYAYYTHCMAS